MAAIHPGVVGDGPDRVRLTAAAIVALVAWAVTIALDATGTAGVLHHDALLEGGPPPPVALGLFAASWILMLAAMMVPASLVVIGRSGSVAWIGAFALVWMGVGLVGFVGDGVLHRTVDAWPWLDRHRWLIPALTLAVAGLYQFTPTKRRSLDRCRRAPHGDPRRSGSSSPFMAGWRHAVDCLGSSGALMLLLFAEGMASLVPMVLLTALMAYEAHGRHGHALARVDGIGLVVLAIDVAVGPGPFVG